MQIGILSDIHANVPALEAVLAAADRRGIDQFLVAGDTVGYNMDPGGVLDLLSGRKVHYVRGNHEDSLRLVYEVPETITVFEERFRPPLEAALRLDPKEIDWLINLPHPLRLELGGKKVLLCHGTPWDISFYLYENERPDLFQRMDKIGMDLIVMGHTHLQYTKRVGGTLFVNPGTVGMPRQGQTGAFWAVYDTFQGSAELMREELPCLVS